MTAEALADRLVAQGAFDAFSEFAQVLPYAIVIDLVGLNDGGKGKNAGMGSGDGDLVDGFNARSRKAFDTLVGLREYLDEHGQAKHLKEGVLRGGFSMWRQSMVFRGQGDDAGLHRN